MLRSMRLAELTALILLTGALAASAGVGLAQGAPPNARQACRASALSLCHAEALAHDMAGVRACLVRNFDKVSPDCQAAMKAVRDGKADPDPQPPPGAQPAPEPPPHR